jgi:hypothetical protein
VFEKLRTANVGFIRAPVVVVILQQRQGAFHGNAGHERDTGPVMDQTIGNLNRFAFLFCLLLAYFELSAMEQIIKASSARLGQRVHPKERTARANLGIHASLGVAHVVVEGFDGFLFQFRGDARGRRRDVLAVMERRKRTPLTTSL